MAFGKRKIIIWCMCAICGVALGSYLSIQVYVNYRCNKAHEIANQYLEDTYEKDFLYRGTEWLWVEGYFWVHYTEPTEKITFQVRVSQKKNSGSYTDDNYKAALCETKAEEEFSRLFSNELEKMFGENVKLMVWIDRQYRFDRCFYDYKNLKTMLTDVTYSVNVKTDLECSIQSEEKFRNVLEQEGYFPTDVYVYSAH